MVILQVANIAILLNRSTTIKILSFFFRVVGKSTTKSIEMSHHGAVEMGKGVYNPWLVSVPLAAWQTWHRFTNSLMSFDMFDQ
jgi:hypothetical protein